MLDILIASIGMILAFILPGYIWSYVFFPESREVTANGIAFSFLERLILSFILSITIVTLAVFYFDYIFNAPIQAATIIIVSIVIGLIGLFALSRLNPEIVQGWKSFFNKSILQRIICFIKKST